jgi:hypothetical protein
LSGTRLVIKNPIKSNIYDESADLARGAVSGHAIPATPAAMTSA